VQTLKTAAIVVLLMTVMYGAYVSLTTPPEPLPADVEDMLIASEEEAMAIDVGLPASLGEMEFEDSATFNAPSASDDLWTAPQFAYSDSNAAAPDAIAGLGPEMGGLGLGNQPVTASLSDSASSLPAAAEGPSIADRDYPTTSGTFDLPDPNSAADRLQPETTASAGPRDYPATGSTFQLPDPDQVVDKMNARASGGASNLALASGTSDLSSSGGEGGSRGAGGSEVSGPGIQMSSGLSNAFRLADSQYTQDKLKEALSTLSLFYHSPSMTGEQRSALLARLDPLAREVIYSTRHLLEQPYRVGQNETLMDVATRFEVPWQLLANINQISDPVAIVPGTELKMVRGPFRAEVSLTQKELTLFLGDLYAGRFPVGIGNDPAPKPGTFTIQDKQTEHTFYDAAGRPIPPGSQDNPYGNVWMDLGGHLSIHGSPSTTNPTEKGCISLAGDFAEDLYGILSKGSSVTIRR
jgi:lipoprotein-anchoring transpeptidase ErfK/SrfK/uncharacterized membrane protein YgcG